MLYDSMVKTADQAVVESFSPSQLLVQLENFGLTPNQFRIYYHLLMKAQGSVATVGSEAIARVCKLTRTTVIRVLAQLVEMNLIQCDRNVGKTTSFHLQLPESWQHIKQQEQKVNKKVVQLKSHQTCTPSIHVQETNTSPVSELNTPQQESTHHPPIGGGGVVDDPDIPVNETDNPQPVNEIHTSLDGKLAAARERGWWDTGRWWDEGGQLHITVNRFVVSVEEFMQRSLNSFSTKVEINLPGLEMCRAKIREIKQRKAQYGY